jgi:hypothetical protein
VLKQRSPFEGRSIEVRSKDLKSQVLRRFEGEVDQALVETFTFGQPEGSAMDRMRTRSQHNSNNNNSDSVASNCAPSDAIPSRTTNESDAIPSRDEMASNFDELIGFP